MNSQSQIFTHGLDPFITAIILAGKIRFIFRGSLLAYLVSLITVMIPREDDVSIVTFGTSNLNTFIGADPLICGEPTHLTGKDRKPVRGLGIRLRQPDYNPNNLPLDFVLRNVTWMRKVVVARIYFCHW